MKIQLGVGCLLLAACAGVVVAGPVVMSGVGAMQDSGGAFNPSMGAVRYRNFGNSGGGDMYLGVDGLGAGGNRVETGAWSWGQNSTQSFSFTYDAGNDRLVSTLGSLSLTYNNFAAMAEAVNGSQKYNEAWNALQISVKLRQSVDHALALEDVLFNGDTLNIDQFDGVYSGTQTWQIWGFDFRNSFSLSGTIRLAGPSAWGTSQELNAVDIGFGNDHRAGPEVVPLPSASALAGIGLVALGARRRRGTSAAM